MIKILCLISALLLYINVQAQINLSDYAEISVITCGPGQEAVFTAFGHSAFRVYDPMNNINHAYNYGVFDFDQPNFYLNFARGYNYYKLAVQDYRNFEYYYIYNNRYVHEQVLNLTQVQKQELFDFLQWNALPENQFYRYDYFYDNCATKIPEVVAKVFGDAVVFDGSYITTNYSIRQLTDIYLKYQPWGDLGIDLCLGLPMDKVASPYEYMFLPDYVESSFDHANINGEPLVKEKRTIYAAVDEEFSNGIFQPLIIFMILAFIAVIMTVNDNKRKKIAHWFDVLVFSTVGAIGVLLLLLWVATDHKAAAFNLNLLWAVPTHLAFVYGILKKQQWIIYYSNFVMGINIVLLITWAWLPQMLHYSIAPLIAALAMRAFLYSDFSHMLRRNSN
ncbi:MAG TPA: DUF4105 domain-containing protein [Cyclobacteriaceae bacterium]|nr:DUF4105 domain-containing protein [Cyclobacteriaceae bacterium]